MPRTNYTFEFSEVPEDAVHPAHPGLRWTDATRKTIRRGSEVYVNNCPPTRETLNLFTKRRGEVASVVQFSLGFRNGQWADTLPLDSLTAGEYWLGLWRPGVPFTNKPEDQDPRTQTPERYFEAHPPGNGNGHHSVVILVEDFLIYEAIEATSASQGRPGVPAHPALRVSGGGNTLTIKRGEMPEVDTSALQGHRDVDLYRIKIQSDGKPDLKTGSRTWIQLDRGMRSLRFDGVAAGTYWVGVWDAETVLSYANEDEDPRENTPAKFFARHPATGSGSGNHHSVVVIVEDVVP